MPSPSSIISLLTYDEIDEVVLNQPRKKIIVYGDFKNMATALFIPNVMEEIVYNSKNNNTIDSCIFQSMLYFTAYWRNYFKSRNLNGKVIISNDMGDSRYHTSINKKYKISRSIGTVNLPDYYDAFTKIRAKNFELAKTMLNDVPNCNYIHLDFLESDFVPYYFMTRKLKSDDVFHIIYSNDKDMYQCLQKPNVVQMSKIRGNITVLNHNNCLHQYCNTNAGSAKMQFKIKDIICKFDLKNIPLIMAIVGDAGDDVPGIKGYGPKTVIKMFEDQHLINRLFGNSDEIIERVSNGKSVFRDGAFATERESKYWKVAIDNSALITDSYKQISFEMLVRWLETEDEIFKIERLNKLNSIFNKTQDKLIKTSNILIESLNKIDRCQISESEMECIFS